MANAAIITRGSGRVPRNCVSLNSAVLFIFKHLKLRIYYYSMESAPRATPKATNFLALSL
jgi:hypothetical protein